MTESNDENCLVDLCWNAAFRRRIDHQRFSVRAGQFGGHTLYMHVPFGFEQRAVSDDCLVLSPPQKPSSKSFFPFISRQSPITGCVFVLEPDPPERG